jgi:hypothetical protein
MVTGSIKPIVQKKAGKQKEKSQTAGPLPAQAHHAKTFVTKSVLIRAIFNTLVVPKAMG